jgi:hypothetical protein
MASSARADERPTGAAAASPSAGIHVFEPVRLRYVRNLQGFPPGWNAIGTYGVDVGFTGLQDVTKRPNTANWTTVRPLFNYTYDVYGLKYIYYTGYYDSWAVKEREMTKLDTQTEGPMIAGECSIAPTAVAYVNGVANTEDVAYESLARLRSEFGLERNGVPLQYELFYNQTGCSTNKIACLEDVAEVFQQRNAETKGALMAPWTHFWEMLAGTIGQPNSWTGVALLTSGAMQAYVGEVIQNNGVTEHLTQLTKQLLTRPPAEYDTSLHVSRLSDLMGQ